MKGSISSQYLSAILMIAPLVGNITVEITGKQISKPYIDMTIDTMDKFGVKVSNENYKRYKIELRNLGYKGKIVKSTLYKIPKLKLNAFQVI